MKITNMMKCEICKQREAKKTYAYYRNLANPYAEVCFGCYAEAEDYYDRKK